MKATYSIATEELEVYKCIFDAKPDVKLIEIDTYRTLTTDTPFIPDLFEYQMRTVNETEIKCIVYKQNLPHTGLLENAMPFLYYIDRDLQIHMTNYTCYMFAGATKLYAIYCNRMNMSRVVNMSHMFDGCISLKCIICDKWNTKSLSVVDYMFHNCINLQTIVINKWFTDYIMSAVKMFSNCYNLKSVGSDLSEWCTRNLIDISYMFENVQSISPAIKWHHLPKQCICIDTFTGQLRDIMKSIQRV